MKQLFKNFENQFKQNQYKNGVIVNNFDVSAAAAKFHVLENSHYVST